MGEPRATRKTDDRRDVPASRHFQRGLVAGFILLAALIVVVAFWGWSQQAGSIRSQAEANLMAVSELQADEIAAWLGERESDAESIRGDPLLAGAARQVAEETAGDGTVTHVRSRLASLQRNYGYLDVVLASPDGEILLREPAGMTHQLSATTQATIAEAARTGEVRSTGLYLAEDGDVRLEWAAPLLPEGPGGAVAGVVLLHADPDEYLYPLLDEWPVPTRSGESLLVERRGDEVVFISPLRHRAEAALRYTIPLARTDLPAAQAVQGAHGAVTGIDYRGVDVLAAAQSVPGSPWYVVAKVDADEILGPISSRGWTAAAFALVAVALAGTGTLLLWRRRESQVATALIAREREFASLFEGMMEGVATHELVRDAGGTPVDYLILDVNPAFAEQTGLAADEVRGRRGSEVFASELPPFLDEYARSVDTGSDQRLEGYVEPLGRHLQVSVTPQGGERFAAIVQDVTPAKLHEQELAASEALFRYVFENALVGMSMTEPTGEVHVNQALCLMLGYAPEDLRDKRWQEITPPEDIPEIEARLAPLLAGTADAARFQKRYLRKDGGIVWADVSTRLRRDDAGEPLYFITAVLDISHRVKAEMRISRLNEELEQRVADRTAELDAANKELEAFAYSVSHDLRAPLRHVSGFSALLSARAGDQLDDKSRHYVERISDSVNEMGTLIDDLLAFSRTGRKELSIERVDMDALVAEALAPLREDTRDRSVDWVVTPLPPTAGDRSLLRQVWANLLDNAVKYTRGRDPARVEIGALEEDHSNVFYVRDNGVGFDMEYAHKLFGVFQRLHSAAEFEGTGIGLANVQRIIARHGGRVWAEGATGEGAAFYFSLPRRRETPT
jgi:PAS domain S-box-containing protein